jgi:hypothetical protein
VRFARAEAQQQHLRAIASSGHQRRVFLFA